MKIISYNIQYGTGIHRGAWEYLLPWKYFWSSRTTLKSIIEALKKERVDVLTMTEVDSGSRGENQINLFSKSLELKQAFSACKYEGNPIGRILTGIPYLRDNSGAILSKVKFVRTKKHFFSTGVKRLFLEAVIQKNNKKVSIMSAHLSLGKTSRVKQLKEIAAVVKTIKHPVILTGDFNTTPDSNEIKEFISKSGLKNAIPNCGATFPSWKPRSCLDYLFVSKDLKVKKSGVLDWNEFSDHLPVFAEISL